MVGDNSLLCGRYLVVLKTLQQLTLKKNFLQNYNNNDERHIIYIFGDGGGGGGGYIDNETKISPAPK